MRLVLLLSALLFIVCTPKQVIQQIPERVIVKYLPAETASIVDSSIVSSEIRHDTILNTDTVIVTKTRWKSTVKEIRTVDTIPKYIVRNDTVEVEKRMPVAPWKWWVVGSIGFAFGAVLIFSVRKIL
jgi:hypothetical protein